ncbi:MAG: T9SS type A sorting domain-containing protein [Candidatus Methylacidiphilales bacterium]
MKKIYILFCFILLSVNVFSQNGLYGIVRKNYYSIVRNPTDTNQKFEQFDSATIRLGFLNPASGQVSNIGSNLYNQTINLTGAALNPYDSTFIYIGADKINTIDLNTGVIINSIPLLNPIQSSYFDNFRFNNSDSTMYGLARRSYLDPITNTLTGEVYMAKANTNTGVITQISPSSVGNGYALLGSSIDPYQMVYYYSDGTHIIGLDIYTGLVYSKVLINNVFGTTFGNFTYNCNDNKIYGLIGKNYFRTVTDSLGTYEKLDSNTQTLGTINPNSGIVTQVSANTLSKVGYTINGGSTIDPNTNTYYFNIGTKLIGVSIFDGTIVSYPNFIFSDGQYFDLIRNLQSCYSANSLRKKPTNVAFVNSQKNNIQVYPNPFKNKVSVNGGNQQIETVEIYSISGNLIKKQNITGNGQEIELSELKSGIYFLKINTPENESTFIKICKSE